MYFYSLFILLQTPFNFPLSLTFFKLAPALAW